MSAIPVRINLNYSPLKNDDSAYLKFKSQEWMTKSLVLRLHEHFGHIEIAYEMRRQSKRLSGRCSCLLSTTEKKVENVRINRKYLFFLRWTWSSGSKLFWRPATIRPYGERCMLLGGQTLINKFEEKNVKSSCWRHGHHHAARCTAWSTTQTERWRPILRRRSNCLFASRNGYFYPFLFCCWIERLSEATLKLV